MKKRLADLFSMATLPLDFQTRIWKHGFGTGLLSMGVLLGSAAYIGTHQGPGEPFDLHQSAEAYTDRMVRHDPSINRQDFLVRQQAIAERYEQQRIYVLLGMAALAAAGAGFCYRKLRAVQNTAPRPK